MMRYRNLFMLCIGMMALFFVAGAAYAENVCVAVSDAGDAVKLHLRAQPSTESQSHRLYFNGARVICHCDSTVNGWMSVTAGAQQEAVLCSGPSNQDAVVACAAPGTWLALLGETGECGYLAQYVNAEVADVQVPESVSLTGYAQILQGEESFVNATDGMKLTMDDLDRCFGLLEEMTATRYASIDLDADGEEEVVVCVACSSSDFGYLVLDETDERVYGHAFYIRAMHDLKADGTFAYSSGAADSGIGYLCLDGASAQVVEIAGLRFQADGAIHYYAGGQKVTEEVFRQIEQAQCLKAAPVWQSCL